MVVMIVVFKGGSACTSNFKNAISLMHMTTKYIFGNNCTVVSELVVVANIVNFFPKLLWNAHSFIFLGWNGQLSLATEFLTLVMGFVLKTVNIIIKLVQIFRCGIRAAQCRAIFWLTCGWLELHDSHADICGLLHKS